MTDPLEKLLEQLEESAPKPRAEQRKKDISLAMEAFDAAKVAKRETRQFRPGFATVLSRIAETVRRPFVSIPSGIVVAGLAVFAFMPALNPGTVELTFSESSSPVEKVEKNRGLTPDAAVEMALSTVKGFLGPKDPSDAAGSFGALPPVGPETLTLRLVSGGVLTLKNSGDAVNLNIDVQGVGSFPVTAHLQPENCPDEYICLGSSHRFNSFSEAGIIIWPAAIACWDAQAEFTARFSLMVIDAAGQSSAAQTIRIVCRLD